MKSSSSTTEGLRPGTSSTSTASATRSPPDTILVGIVLRPHGVRGELTVASQTDNERRFAADSTLILNLPGRNDTRTVRIARSSPYKGGFRIAFDGVVDRNAAEALRGAELSVPREAVPEARAGSYYFFELIGCRCVDERDGDLGAVVEVVADGGGWLLEVEARDGESGRRIALPFVEEFVVHVDRAGRRIDWRLPEGLVEACASRF